MTLLKKSEQVLKRLVGLLAGLLLWRPGARARVDPRLQGPKRALLVRIDKRVGEALLVTPLLSMLKQTYPALEIDLLLHPSMCRVLAFHPIPHALVAFKRERLWWIGRGRQLAELRARDYDVVVDLGNWSEPSITHALLSRLCGPRAAVLGSDLFSVRSLRTHPVPCRKDTRRELLQRLQLLAPLRLSDSPPSSLLLHFYPGQPSPDCEALLGQVRKGRYVILNPGGRLDWRRLPAELFADAASQLLQAGYTPLVTWGPGEEALAQQIASQVPGAQLAPPTSLDDLAHLMVAAGRVVCNNTGPMHLAVATGAATLQLFASMDPARWGYPDAPHLVLDLGHARASTEALKVPLRRALQIFLAQAPGP